MIRFINHTTGSLMWVHESRVEEYRKLHPPVPAR